jgi:hypothetical protein
LNQILHHQFLADMAPNVKLPAKIALLRKMLERREHLFDSFGGKTTAQTIGEEWEKM